MMHSKKYLQLFSVLCFWLITSTQVFAAYPDPVDDYVNDFANIIDEDYTNMIQSRLKSLESETGIEMVVVTINAMRDYDSALQYGLKNFAKKLFNQWGVGQLPDNDGVMILVSVKDKMVRIHMGKGYNHRYDSEMKTIISETIAPEFSQKNYAEGLYRGAMAVMSEITRPPTLWDKHKWYLIFVPIGTLLFGAGISLLRKGQKGWGWALITVGGTILASLLLAFLSSKDDEDHYQEGFGGGSSDDDGAEGTWD